VIAFMRHVGCPFAEATFRSLRQCAGARPDVRFVAVSHAPEAPTRAWCDTVAGGVGAVEVVFDEPRRLYAAWGLGTTSAAHFLGARSLRRAARLAAGGIRNRHPVGTRWQSAGTFAVGADGIVRWRHVPDSAAALPDLDAAVAALTTDAA
jgi:hypothetical protein